MKKLFCLQVSFYLSNTHLSKKFIYNFENNNSEIHESNDFSESIILNKNNNFDKRKPLDLSKIKRRIAKIEEAEKKSKQEEQAEQTDYTSKSIGIAIEKAQNKIVKTKNSTEDSTEDKEKNNNKHKLKISQKLKNFKNFMFQTEETNELCKTIEGEIKLQSKTVLSQLENCKSFYSSIE